jgi:hypothetical protein
MNQTWPPHSYSPTEIGLGDLIGQLSDLRWGFYKLHLQVAAALKAAPIRSL